MKKAIFIPTEEQKKLAGLQSTEILNALTKCSKDIMLQAYILQIVLECFEEQYKLSIRDGYSVSNNKENRPTPSETK